MVVGGGVVGYNAAVIALGLGAQVTILERSIDRMRHLEEVLSGRVSLLMSSSLQVAASVEDADLVIGAVLIPGALAPKLVTREMISSMKEGAVVVDVAIDQGGCFETSHATTHAEPVYVVDGVIALLRREHARRCADHLDQGADERDASVRRGDREQGPAAAVADDPGARQGRERDRGQGDLRGCRRGARPRLHAARRRLPLSAV